jgi:hypothetical protein
MRKVFLTTVMALAALQVASAAEATFESPDKHIVVTISDNGGKPTYQVTLDGVTFIEQSPLGLKALLSPLNSYLIAYLKLVLAPVLLVDELNPHPFAIL